MKKSLLTLAMLFLCGYSQAQNSRSQDLITKSQAQATKRMLFEINGSTDHSLKVDGFTDAREFTVRRGLPNFFSKCAQGKDVTVAYIGGSITQNSHMYRSQCADYLASLFPNVKMTGVNAGVGGTGSELGTCRLDRQVLAFNPDLVFVEFAVNGSHAPGVEGIVRQIIRHNPKCDICIIYTIYGGQSEIYGKGEIPSNIERLEKVAIHYNLPSVHMGMWSGYLLNEDKLLWSAPKGYKGDKIIFTKDGVHPTEAGGDLYATAVARAFEAMKDNRADEPQKLIEPLLANQMDRGTFISPGEALRSAKGWTVTRCDEIPSIKRFGQWFDLVATAEAKCEPYRFKFKGDFLGVYNFGAPDAGAIDVIINGKKIVPSKYNHNRKVIAFDFVDRNDPRPSIYSFNPYSSIYRSQYECIDLKEGVYDVEIYPHAKRIDKAKIVEEYIKSGKKSNIPLKNGKLPAEYKPQIVRLGWIMINGEELER
ncbi:MAG: SGNH/GDSL hydrolase family protein [Rikenellaceae bacterium]